MIAFYFLLFLIIAGPGIYLGGNLITPTDLVIPVLFLVYFKGQVKKIPILKYLFFYVFSISISLLIGFVLDNGIMFSSVLKGIRFSYVLLIPSIIDNYIRKSKYNEDKVFLSILISAIVSSLIGIILFISQSTLYQAPERFIFFGNYIYRAGGVFAEANYFGFAMSIMCMIAIESIAQKKFIPISLIAIATCGIGIVFSDSRSALFSLAVALFIRFCDLTKKRNIQIITALIIGVCIIYFSIPSFKNYIDNRIFSVFVSYLNGEGVNSISSGRISIWLNAINDFSNNSFLEILFGTGYKSESLNILSDNSYISTLVTLGLFGTWSFTALWLHLMKSAKRFVSVQNSLFNNVFKSLVIMFLVNMIFLDSMTFTRMMYLLVVVYMICYVEKK